MSSKKRICTICKSKFVSSSRHLKCHTCRKKKGKCGGCGATVHISYNKYCRACSGKEARNNNWKGGRTRHKKGYVMVRVPGHPRASLGYVFEHILVMEQKLGRHLRPGETIHHKNTIKDDNRPKNLELWLGSQPSGGRVSDLVKWAKELLTKYSPESLA